MAVAIISKYINEESISAINIEWSVREVCVGVLLKMIAPNRIER